MLPPCPLTARRFSKPWWTSESQTSRNTCRKVVVESRIEPGNCMWYQESVTFSVGATSTLSPSASASSAARTARERAMKQSVSSGMWGPCCSVVLLGRADRDQHGVDPLRDALVDLLPRQPFDQVLRHPAIFTECQTSCNTRPSMEG